MMMGEAILLWLALGCIFVLLIALLIEKKEHKKLDKEYSNLKDEYSTALSSISERERNLAVKKDEIFLETAGLKKCYKFFQMERELFNDSIQRSLEELGTIAISKFYVSKQKYYLDNFSLYPEIVNARKKFSSQAISEAIHTARKSAAYEDFKVRRSEKLDNANLGMAHGYVYAMFNVSLPGVIKIGCSDAPLIRAKELTCGENFRCNEDYAKLKAEFDKYSIGNNAKCSNVLHEYTQRLNIKLKTSLPSPFIVAFYCESYNAFEDECLLHYALKEFNIHRGAGIEFFALTLQEAYEIFKIAFPNRGYQFPNFTPEQ